MLLTSTRDTAIQEWRTLQEYHINSIRVIQIIISIADLKIKESQITYEIQAMPRIAWQQQEQ